MWTKEQKEEIWARSIWNEAWRLGDDILIALAEKFPRYFEIVDNEFKMKEYETTL